MGLKRSIIHPRGVSILVRFGKTKISAAGRTPAPSGSAKRPAKSRSEVEKEDEIDVIECAKKLGRANMLIPSADALARGPIPPRPFVLCDRRLSQFLGQNNRPCPS